MQRTPTRLEKASDLEATSYTRKQPSLLPVEMVTALIILHARCSCGADNTLETIPILERKVGQVAESGEIPVQTVRPDRLSGSGASRNNQQVSRAEE